MVAGDWHGAAYAGRPLAQMREFLVVLRECLSGEPVTFCGDFYRLRKFRLGVDLADRPPKIIAQFHPAGFGDVVAAIRAAHLAGDRAAALGAVPHQMIDAIEVVGSSHLVAATIAAYRNAGVQVPVIFPVTWVAAGTDETTTLDATLRAAARSQAPAPGRNAS